jgi:hypothetical protein
LEGWSVNNHPVRSTIPIAAQMIAERMHLTSPQNEPLKQVLGQVQMQQACALVVPSVRYRHSA